MNKVAQESGWLTDNNIRAEGGRKTNAPAPYAQYTGNKTETNWHFNEELAMLWQELQSPITDPRMRQNISLSQADVKSLSSLMRAGTDVAMLV